jgi:O-antigen/teichoic acid export membrane protein
MTAATTVAGGGGSGFAGARTALRLSFGASILIQGCNVVTGLLLARTLGPIARGELAAVVLWPSMLATVGSLGITDAATFYAARRTTELGGLIGSSLVIVAAQSVVCVGAGLVIIPLVFARYDASAMHAAYVFLAFAPLNLLLISSAAMLNGLHRFGQYQAVRFVSAASVAIAIVSLRLIDVLSVLNAAMVYLGVTGVTGIVAFALLWGRERPRLSFRLAMARRMLGFGIKSHSGIVTAMMNERLDQLVISVFLAPIQLGLYATAATLTAPINLVGSSIAVAALPTIARLETPEAQRDAVRGFLRLTLLASTAIVIPALIFTGPIISFFFKDVYLGATGVTRVLLIAAVALSMNRAMAACAKALDRPLDSGISEMLGLVVTTVSLALLLPSLGIMGAAVASLLAYGAGMAWMLRRTTRALGMSVASVFLPAAGVRRMARPSYWRAAAVKAGE